MRALTFLAAFLFLGSGGYILRGLVQNHIAQVTVAHADDVADHIQHMLNDSGEARAILNGGQRAHMLHGDLMHSMHSANVVKKVYFGPDNAPIVIQNLQIHSQHDDPASLAKLVFTQNELDALDANRPVVSTPITTTPLRDLEGQFVRTVRTVEDRSGEVLGRVLLVIDVAEVRSAYEEGLWYLAIVLTVFGTALVGVPVAAYAIQRKYARQSKRDADYLAHHDTLTGLQNRGSFLDQAEGLRTTGALSGVAYIDVDHFKTINDTRGHAAGDAILQQLATCMRDVCLDKDVVARFGGDEFVIAFASADAFRMTTALERVREKMSNVSCGVASTVSASVSIGLRVGDGDTLSVAAFLADADSALYFAKTQGRDQVCRFTPKMGESRRRLRALEARIREAAEKHLFDIHYQPLVDAKTGQTIGYEALLRLNDHDGTSISPAVFVPLAEELGLIESIGAWVLRQATRDIAACSEPLMLAINLSPQQFKSGDLLDVVKQALSEAELPPSQLELEITESLLLDDNIETTLQIDALKELGVSIAMDDFGTGFSSLSYLWKYGFDRLKIDRTFIAALEHKPDKSRDLIEAIVMLGDRLGMQVTAEGIETPDQSQLLSELGCDVLQGYYFGRPAPLHQLSPRSLNRA